MTSLPGQAGAAMGGQFSVLHRSLSELGTNTTSIGNTLNDSVHGRSAGLGSASGDLETHAALHDCAGFWVGKLTDLSTDVQQVGANINRNASAYQQVDTQIAATFDRIRLPEIAPGG